MTMNAAGLLMLPLLVAPAGAQAAQEHDLWNGAQIMDAVQSRQTEFPYVYEEQSIVRVDRNGLRDTRTARRYSRVEPDGNVHVLLVFETPPEIRGTTLIAHRDPGGMVTKQLYLPALGPQLIASDADDRGGGFLGTDFTVESLTGEMMSEYRYVRGGDEEIDNQAYFSVDVFRAGDDPNRTQPLRRHFIRKDNLFITRTDFFDIRGGVAKRQRSYDLRVVDETMWHANLMLMDDYREQHQTLIKVDRRVFSRDYVPADMFGAAWLFEHYPAPPDPAVPATDATVPDDAEGGTP
ncbi:MAG: outer membrane lipoprotein-sorting protein [Gammaproteobacteria bacterium]|nr:outer membrane lipoprotein-sorting protein [Gammaproteobacteria bacterium]